MPSVGRLPRQVVALLILGFVLAVGLSVRLATNSTQQGMVLGSSTAGALIDERFGSTASEKDFTVITGGPWTSGGWAFTLTQPVDGAGPPGNSNVVVHNTQLSGDWTLTARIGALSSHPGRDSYSMVFGFAGPSDYLYANVSVRPMPGQDGVFKVNRGRSVKLLDFPASELGKANKNDDITLTKAGTTVTFARDRTALGSVADLNMLQSSRIGFGSRGSRVVARHLLVVRGADSSTTSSGPPAPTPASTTPPTPKATPSSTPTPQPHPTPTPTQAPTQGSTPPPTPASTPPSGSGGSSSSFADFFRPDFAGSTFCPFQHQNVSISGGVLTVTYAAGSSAPSAGAPYGGAQICVPFSGGSASDASLSYDVRFPVGFQFVKGGKLPGLYGGVEPFSGGSHNPNGWSMRLMWRANGAAEVYGYISTTTGYGDDWGRGNFSFQADGQWHHLTEHIHLNTPGQSDGWVTLAYDGTIYINQTGLAITTTNTPISGLFFSTFYGGHDSSWAPSADMHLDFASFRRV